MNDLIVQINKSTRKVILEQIYIGNDHENLQEKLVFQFEDEFVNGQGRLEYEIDGDKNYIILQKEEETYTIPVQNVITIYQEETAGKIKFQLVVTEGTEQENIPVFKSNIFFLKCRPSINAVTEAPEGYDLWIEQANAKLNAMDEALTEVDNLDIDANKVGKITSIVITKKDGTQKTINVDDGVSLEYLWQGTSLGIKREDEQNYDFVNLKGEKGDTGEAGAIKMLIVNQLPLTGEEGTLYFVPKADTEISDLYDEYMWVNNNWELVGEKQITVDLSDYYTKQETNNLLEDKADVEDIPDLTDYVKNTDYASSSTAGVIKVNASGYGTSIDPNGALRALVKNYEQYESSNSYYMIGKGTLENVITGKGLIDSSSDITGNASTSTTLKSFNYSRKGTNNTWAKVATASLVGTWEEKHAYLFVKGTHNSNFKQNGIISIDVIGNATKSKVNSYSAQFISASTDLNVENFYIEYQDGDENTNATINFWVKNTTNTYASWQFKILQNTGWTIESANTSATTLPTQDFTGKISELNNKTLNDKDGNDITTTYAKNTDYASTTKPGLIQVVPSYGTNVNSQTGGLIGQTRDYSQYTSASNQLIISKGTLENVLTERIGSIDTVLETLTVGGGVA